VEAADLRRQVAVLKRERAAFHTELQNSREEINGLRDTIDLLRARVHSLGQHEADNLRRLALFERFEPLFDKLGETFTLKEPCEIVDRLAYLENDQLGLANQLSDAQEEIAKLHSQAKVAATARLSAEARLQQQHSDDISRLVAERDRLEGELKSAEALVRIS
jgi:chromosome segregation ATPase